MVKDTRYQAGQKKVDKGVQNPGKAILFLFFLLLAFLLVLHLPVTQRKITRELTSYLSTKLDSRVEIGSLRFSLYSATSS